MSFQYNGVTVDKLEILWPSIASNLPYKLDDYSNTSIGSKNEADLSNLKAIIRIFCDRKPAKFTEYISFVMVSTFMKLLKSTSTQFHLQSTQLMAHTFNTNVDQWYCDQEKVLVVAEAIWNVSSDPANINHIAISLHGYNQFTFNVSIVLVIAALGNLTTPVKSNKLPLIQLDDIFDRIALDVIKNKTEKQSLFDFLILFQTFQRLASTRSALNESLKNVLVIQQEKLERLKTRLQATLQSLNKTIYDQTDLHENTTISHLIQLVLHEIDALIIA